MKRPLTVCLTGVESTGKTTAAQALAAHLGWPWAPEAARGDAAVREGRTAPDDLARLCDEQRLALDRLHHAPGILSDACPLVIELWGEVVFGCCPVQVYREGLQVDLFLLCAPDLPWEPDPLRTLPDANRRWEHHRLFESRLLDRGWPYVVLTGTGEDRWNAALPRIAALTG
jgi:nicotinamide riboside kinase